MAIGRVKDSKLRVFGNDYPTPDGTCVRDYLHVLDLAKGHLLALDALSPESKVFDNCPTDARFKAYNLGRGQGSSVLQIVEAMRKATGYGFEWEMTGRRYAAYPLVSDAYVDKKFGDTQTRRRPGSHCRPDARRERARLHRTARFGHDVSRPMELADEAPVGLRRARR